MSTALIILAAGQGTRMNSDLPKVLHPIAGAPMLIHALRAGQVLNPDRVIVVAGHGAAEVGKAAQTYDETVEMALQKEQKGTAHAVAQAAPLLSDHDGDAIVLYGDTPLIQPETLTRMIAAREQHDIVVLGFDAQDPGRYGRLIMQNGILERIVEFKDATENERTITFCNSGIIIAPSALLFDLIEAVNNENASGEFYLTDIIGIARTRGLTATAVTCDEVETLGINSRSELATAEAAFQGRTRSDLLKLGVTLTAPETVHLSFDTVIGRDVLIEPNVIFGPGVTVETGAHIRAFSHLEGCHVARDCVIGPFARLRPGTELSENVKIGNFVETKNALVGEGTKINHLSYVGDATLGENTNIGAGVITCNYDGVSKHQTEIGDRVFVGSNTMLVAPVTLGNDVITASGSVITANVPDEALAIARTRQVTKPGLAKKLFQALRLKKQKHQAGEK